MFEQGQGILSPEAVVASIKQLVDSVRDDLRGNGTETLCRVEICLF